MKRAQLETYWSGGKWLVDSTLFAPDVVWLARSVFDHPPTEEDIALAHKEHSIQFDEKEAEYG